MKLKFSADTHTYESVDDPNKKWTSVTSIIKLFKEPFDQEKVAAKSAKNKKSKWYGLSAEEIVRESLNIAVCLNSFVRS